MNRRWYVFLCSYDQSVFKLKILCGQQIYGGFEELEFYMFFCGDMLDEPTKHMEIQGKKLEA